MQKKLAILASALEEIADDCKRRLRKGFDNGDDSVLKKCESALNEVQSLGMTGLELSFAKTAVEAFLDNERDKEATQCLAYELAESLMIEMQEGGEGSMLKLPELKLAILNYCLDQETSAQLDRANEAQSGG